MLKVLDFERLVNSPRNIKNVTHRGWIVKHRVIPASGLKLAAKLWNEKVTGPVLVVVTLQQKLRWMMGAV